MNTFTSADETHRQKLINVVIGQLKRCLESYERSKNMADESSGKLLKIVEAVTGEFGGYLFGLYMFTKLLYIGNVFMQLWALNFWFPHFFTYGADFFRFYSDDYYETSEMFPRYTMCNFIVRVLGNAQRHTVQCVLPVNMVLEKIFLFIWFWMILVAFLSVVSFVMWMLKLLNRSTARAFLTNHVWRGVFRGQRKKKLQRMESYNTELKLIVSQMENFRKVLGIDGYFMLQLIAHNTNVVATTEIVTALYDDWQANDAPDSFLAGRKFSLGGRKKSQPLLGNNGEPSAPTDSLPPKVKWQDSFQGTE